MSKILFINRKQAQKVSTWSGGTTTELCIFPLNADFIERNFLFRISTASIHQNESTFTLFSGFARSLMMLEGSVSLSHQHQNPIEINPFESVRFDGSWHTTSIGIGSDFNVITSAQATHTLSLFSFEKKNKIEIGSTENSVLYLGFYNIGGMVNLSFLSELIVLNTNDFVLIELNHFETIKFKSDGISKLIQVNILAK